MFFDFFSIKFYAQSKATDEVFLGYIFGKAKEKLEYRILCFSKRFSKTVEAELKMPLSNFKEFMNGFFQELLTKSSNISEMTREFMLYFDTQVNKSGGKEAVSLRLSKLSNRKNLML